MTEEEIRIAFEEAVKGKESLRGFWHTKVGRALRSNIVDTPFNDFQGVQEKIWALTNRKMRRPICLMHPPL